MDVQFFHCSSSCAICARGHFLSAASRIMIPSAEMRAGVAVDADSGYMSRKIRKFTTDKFDTRNVIDWFPAVDMSYMSRNFRLLCVSNLSVLNLPFFLLMYSGRCPGPHGGRASRDERGSRRDGSRERR